MPSITEIPLPGPPRPGFPLPPEIILEVASHLTQTRDICRFAETSRDCQDVAEREVTKRMQAEGRPLLALLNPHGVSVQPLHYYRRMARFEDCMQRFLDENRGFRAPPLPSMMDEIVAELNEVRIVTPPPEPPVTLTVVLDMFRGNPVYTRRLTPQALLALFIRNRLNRADRDVDGHESSALTAQAELALRMLEGIGITRPDDVFMAHEAYARIHALHSEVPQMCQALTEIGVDFTRRLREVVCSMACAAARDNRWQVLEHLAGHHEALLSCQKSRPYPLFIAVQCGNLESVSALIIHGFKLPKDALATFRRDPMHIALESQRRNGASTDKFPELAVRRHRAVTLCEPKKRFF